MSGDALIAQSQLMPWAYLGTWAVGLVVIVVGVLRGWW